MTTAKIRTITSIATTGPKRPKDKAIDSSVRTIPPTMVSMNPKIAPKNAKTASVAETKNNSNGDKTMSVKPPVIKLMAGPAVWLYSQEAPFDRSDPRALKKPRTPNI
ncbi:MAG: hypothetical protein ACYDAP_03550 [Thermoplasmataceae archaeon]